MKSRPTVQDPRGFVYPLTPYLRKQEWHLDNLERRMSQLQRQIASVTQTRLAIENQCKQQSAYLHTSQQTRPDPTWHRSGLLHLLELRQQLQRRNQELAELAAQKELLQCERIVQQRKLDGLMEHRSFTLQEHVAEQQRIAAVEADRDWLSRRVSLKHARAFPTEELQ
ncbi:hypothetical protein ACFIQG_21505 [Comamonas odontotermitis]|uniref:hypothetical protein n=1 Tax=Comamonas odontotermitis TaxID=379895 RepID=UPI0036726523